MKDYYKVLGVPRSASTAQIKQAYRRLIKGCHPDVNPSVKAAEWTRELNEAYATLSDVHAKMSYDMDLKLEESKIQETSARQTTRNQSRSETKPSSTSERHFCCEMCGQTDSSLRISAIWRVHSFISYSKKFPTTKILCVRCRVKESLAASAYTAFLGWWNIWGFFWTIESLFYNACGGEQPEVNNVLLLNALGYQLYQAGRRMEAYKALLAAHDLRPDLKAEQLLEYLKKQVQPKERKPFWERFRNLELHPICYHAPAWAVSIVLLFFAFNALNSDSSPASSDVPQQPPESYPPSQNGSLPPQRDGQQYANDHKGYVVVEPEQMPVFSEPEQSLPGQGALLLSDRILFDSGTKAPLTITTRESDGNYVIKIIDWNTGEFMATYFLKRGGTLSVELPLGSYKLKFASGDKWYGAKYLFGPTTAYSFVPDKMVFYIAGDYAKGHRIELIPQAGGNLETPPMRAADW